MKRKKRGWEAPFSSLYLPLYRHVIVVLKSPISSIVYRKALVPLK
jgi:hypothetical protein